MKTLCNFAVRGHQGCVMNI